MLHFRCPNCNATLGASVSAAGQKTHCGVCGQRLQVPVPPPQNKTVLGSFVAVEPDPAPPLEPPPAPPAARQTDYKVLEDEPRRPRPRRRRYREDPSGYVVRCYECGAVTPVEHAERRNMRVRSTRAFWGNPFDFNNWFFGAHYERVDLCPECAEALDEERAANRRLILIIILVLVGLGLFGRLLAALTSG